MPECDEYMKKWLACVDSKVPAEYARDVQGRHRAEQGQLEAGGGPRRRARQSLAMACTQSLAATKQALAAYNCTW